MADVLTVEERVTVLRIVTSVIGVLSDLELKIIFNYMDNNEQTGTVLRMIREILVQHRQEWQTHYRKKLSPS